MSKSPLHAPALADSVQSVAVYAVIRNGSVPDGVYYYDIESQELVNIGQKPMMSAIADAFPEKEIVTQAEEFYIYTGMMERAVWRYREASYRQVQVDVGAACADTMIYAKSKGKRVFPVGAFVDDAVAVALGLGGSEIPLAAVALFPENSAVAFNSVDEGVGEFAYSNRNETLEPGMRYPARFMLQNRGECINELSRCVKVRRVATKALPGEEFPLAPSKFPADYIMREIWFLGEPLVKKVPFGAVTMDLDDFSSILRWMEMGQFNAFGAGLGRVDAVEPVAQVGEHLVVILEPGAEAEAVAARGVDVHSALVADVAHGRVILYAIGDGWHQLVVVGHDDTGGRGKVASHSLVGRELTH